MERELPRYQIKGKIYFRDEKLKEYRAVNDPFERISFDEFLSKGMELETPSGEVYIPLGPESERAAQELRKKEEFELQLEGTVEANVQEVTKIARSASGAMPETMDNIDNWMEENVLEIRRGQSHAGGKWKTMDYELILGVGGPSIYFDTRNCQVEGYWGGKKVKRHVDRDVCRTFEDHLDEVLPE